MRTNDVSFVLRLHHPIFLLLLSAAIHSIAACALLLNIASASTVRTVSLFQGFVLCIRIFLSSPNSLSAYRKKPPETFAKMKYALIARTNEKKGKERRVEKSE